VQLYSHQAAALKAVQSGEDLVVVTPTASGKTLCYNLPVLQTLLEDEEARALYLFPPKPWPRIKWRSSWPGATSWAAE